MCLDLCFVVVLCFAFLHGCVVPVLLIFCQFAAVARTSFSKDRL